MILILLSIAFLVPSCFLFISVSSKKAIDNTFLSLTYTLPNNWIVIKEEWETPKFDSELALETSKKHFSNNLNKYIYKYTLGFYYFDYKTLQECKDRYVTGIRISFKCKYFITKNYEKAQTFVIKENKIFYEN